GLPLLLPDPIQRLQCTDDLTAGRPHWSRLELGPAAPTHPEGRHCLAVASPQAALPSPLGLCARRLRRLWRPAPVAVQRFRSGACLPARSRRLAGGLRQCSLPSATTPRNP